MCPFKTGLFEFVILGALGVVVGFGANAVRTKGAIRPTKNYFAVGPSVQRAAAGIETVITGDGDPGRKGVSGARDGRATSSSGATALSAEEDPYQRVTLDEAIEVFNDPRTAEGLNVFVDARSDDHFEDGHVPGAVQFYPYEVDRFLDDVLIRTNGAYKVIVYCNGGECTDSKYACRELMEAGVPTDALYLLAEGWEAWTAKGLPVATGREED